MMNDVIKKAKEDMDRAVAGLKKEFSKIRTGRANIALLDDVRVDYYGTPSPLTQVGTLSVPEPRLITIQPWERNLIPAIEKAILKADLGLNPSSDGVLVRIPIPALTEERRKEIVKMCKRHGEDHKIAARNVRRDANDALKKLEKNKEITEDALKHGEKEIQELTDKTIKLIDEILAVKEKDVMEV
jgi:ribosome recycling factor